MFCTFWYFTYVNVLQVDNTSVPISDFPVELYPRDPYNKAPRDFLATPRSAHRITTAMGSMSSSWLSRSVTVSSVKKYFYR